MLITFISFHQHTNSGENSMKINAHTNLSIQTNGKDLLHVETFTHVGRIVTNTWHYRRGYIA